MVVKQAVPCKRAGCRGTCPEFVILAGKKNGVPAVCRVCGGAFKLSPGSATYADVAKAAGKGGAKAGGVQSADKALVAKFERLQKENALLKGKAERSDGPGASPESPSGEHDDLALAVALLETLRKAQSQGADVAGALLEQQGKVQRLRDARLASKPAHAQLRQLDEQIGKKRKAVERFEATAVECSGKAQAALEQAEEAKGELDKLKAQKLALTSAALEDVQAMAGDPLGQLSDFAAAVKGLVGDLGAATSPRVCELQVCFTALEECLTKLRAETAAAAAPPPPRPADAAMAQASATPLAPEDAADEFEADEVNAAWMQEHGVKREILVGLLGMQAKRPRREARG